jgi:RNA polymerase sigma factor (sigma-70 family)
VLKRGVDDTLLARLATDVDGSFEDLVRAEQHFVFGVARRLTLDRHDAEEVAQEAFVRAYRALTGYEPDRIRALRVRPWLARIALNVQRNRVRRRRDVVPIDTTEHVSLFTTAADDGPEARAEARAWRDACVGWLHSLPEPYRLAVALRHIDGLAYAEVAEVLGRPVGTVKAQVHRGLGMLRDIVDEAGGQQWKAGA